MDSRAKLLWQNVGIGICPWMGRAVMTVGHVYGRIKASEGTRVSLVRYQVEIRIAYSADIS